MIPSRRSNPFGSRWNDWVGTSAPLQHKILLTSALLLSILIAGASYQFYYHQKKARYQKIITGFYQKYFNIEPLASHRDHWVFMTLHQKRGLEKVEKNFFIPSSKHPNG